MKKKEWNEGLDHIDPDLVARYIAQKEALTAKHKPKTGWLRVGALAACLCLIVTGVFGGVGLLKDHFSDATAPITQHTPDLPLDNYPPDEVDYANMSMVEYMELHPDFLSYRYMPWDENYAFAHLEILEVKGGYNKGDGKYSSYVVKCRVFADAWNALEEGSELNLVCTYREAEFFETISSVLLRFEVRGTFAYTNKDGETGYGMLLDQAFNYLGCFPLEDGKVKLNIMEEYLKTNNLKLNYVGNHKISSDPDYVYCTFDDVASIVDDEMAVETAVENLRDVYEKYQTGEYNHNFSVDLISKMNYGEYIRLTKQESTPEDFKKFGTEIKLAYLVFPREESRDIIFSDGTVYPFLTVMKLPEDAWEMLMKEVAEFEQACTDENGVLNAEACIQKIKQREGTYNVWSVLGGYELR